MSSTMKRIVGLLLGMFIVAAASLAAAPAASADVPPQGTSQASNNGSSICSPPHQVSLGGDQVSSLSLLPIDRWSSAASASQHTRLDANFGDMTQKVQRGAIDSMAFAAGNTMWQAATELTGFATRFCLLDTMGLTADKGAATLGNAIMSSGLVAAVVGFGLLLLLWRTARRGSPADMWKNVTKTVIILGLFGILIAGAAQTTGTDPGNNNQGASDNHTTFGTGSPGWFADRVNRTVSSLASVPAESLASQSATLVNPDNVDGGSLSCNTYLKNLHDAYTRSYGGSAASDLQAAIPLTLSSMWENSGMVAWRNAQFGAENPYSIQMYCRQLENIAGAKVTLPPGTKGTAADLANTQFALSGVGPGSNANKDSAAWVMPGGLEVDRAMVAWAACRSDNGGATWTVDPGWANISGDNKITKENCTDWWTKPLYGSNSFSPSKTGFNWEDSQTDIAQKAAGQPGVQNFLLNWHGNANSAATVVALTFAASSLIILLVFGVLALAIIIAKVAAIVMILVALLVLLIALIPSKGDSNKALAFGKFYVGLTIFAFGIQFLFALISLVTGFLVIAGARQFGAGSILSMIWTGFAPVTAVVVLHLIFTKALKMPSPFKPSAALAYGAAAGGIGAGVGAGIDRLVNRGKSQVKSRAASGGRSALSAVGVGPSNASRRSDSMAKTMAPAVNTATSAGGKTDNSAVVVNNGKTTDTKNTAVVGAGLGGAGGKNGAAGKDGALVGAGIGGAGGKDGKDGAIVGVGGAAKDGVTATDGTADKDGALVGGVAAGAGAAGNGRQSVVAAGTATKRDERLERRAQATRLKDARAYDRTLAGGRLGQARSAVTDRGAAAWETFKEKPVRNSVKALGVGVLGAAGGVPLALVGTGVLAARAMQRRRENPVDRPALRMLDNTRVLDQYRDHLTAVADAAKPGEQESAPIDLRQKEGYQELQGNGVAEQSMGNGAPPQDPTPPTFGPGSGASPSVGRSSAPPTFGPGSGASPSVGRSSAPPTFGPGSGASPSVGRPANTPANLQPTGTAEQSMGNGAPPQDPTPLDGPAPTQDPTRSTVPATAGRSSAPTSFGAGPGTSPSVGQSANPPAGTAPPRADSVPAAPPVTDPGSAAGQPGSVVTQPKRRQRRR